MPRRAAKIDLNQPALIEEFERHDCAVKSTAGMGNGFPDLLVWCGKTHHLVEVKQPKGKLNDYQRRFMDMWPGPVHVVRTPIEVMALVQEWRRNPLDELAAQAQELDMGY